MTLNDRHIKNSFYESDKSITSFTPSPALTALKKFSSMGGKTKRAKLDEIKVNGSLGVSVS